ncbi:hypothetical protein GIY56_13405 [Paracoccus sp. YIM 132242]|uniref:Uncharacterized protein n=1 Tax=Paracoccus lichenicola TaxID=2665644 RepID=A0A6L6HSP6_9RHOB|nr:hypothetical protein [Paracoccus lichenicola]MTE01281.1 hypothetical protein [Paracoccus lichenicola]
MTNRAPGPRRLGRAGVAVVVILVAVMLVLFVGRNLWHASEVHDTPPEVEAGQQP